MVSSLWLFSRCDIHETYLFGQETIFFSFFFFYTWHLKTARGLEYSDSWVDSGDANRANRTEIPTHSCPEQPSPQPPIPINSPRLKETCPDWIPASPTILAHDASCNIRHWPPGRLRVECDGHCADLQARSQREGLLSLLRRPREFEGGLLLCGAHALYPSSTGFGRKRITN